MKKNDTISFNWILANYHSSMAIDNDDGDRQTLLLPSRSFDSELHDSLRVVAVELFYTLFALSLVMALQCTIF